MLTFRLKNVFCLILVVGVALMWGVWLASYSNVGHHANERYLANYRTVRPGGFSRSYLALQGKVVGENRAFYSQLVVTFVVGLFVCWLAWPRGWRLNPYKSPEELDTDERIWPVRLNIGWLLLAAYCPIAWVIMEPLAIMGSQMAWIFPQFFLLIPMLVLIPSLAVSALRHPNRSKAAAVGAWSLLAAYVFVSYCSLVWGVFIVACWNLLDRFAANSGM